jgi:hypothetical protein
MMVARKVATPAENLNVRHEESTDSHQLSHIQDFLLPIF